VSAAYQLVELLLAARLDDLDEIHFKFVEDVLAGVLVTEEYRFPAERDAFLEQVQVLPPESVSIVVFVFAS